MAITYLPDFMIDLKNPSWLKDPVFLEAIPCARSRKVWTPKSKQEYIILHRLEFSSMLPPTASAKEKDAERAKVLNDKKTRWRFICMKWPRDPDGKHLTVENSRLGKMTGGKRELIWGATLEDLYYVHRIPGIEGWMTITSGSKMYNWCKAEGEDYEPARRLMKYAEEEEEPRVVPVFGIHELIRSYELTVRMCSGVSWGVRRQNADDDGGQIVPWELPEPWPPKSPFHAYPKPWPLAPFTRGLAGSKMFGEGSYFINDLPTLQEYIPLHLLPEKLVVHDPWELLDAVHTRYIPGEKQDLIRIYKLKPSKIHTERRTQDERDSEDRVAKSQAVRDAFLANPHSSQELPEGILYKGSLGTLISDGTFLKKPDLGPAKPPVFVVYPHRPAPSPAKEAHIFLSPAETIGTGNHSFVYRAEFEVPRSLLVQDDICTVCVYEDTERILLEEDGPDGERRDPKWDELTGQYLLQLQGKPPIHHILGDQVYETRADATKVETVYEGPYRAIQTTVGYQNLERGPYCKHWQEWIIHPLTARTLVAAKLSIQYDTHLGKEAENYQQFSKDFFENYTGYNIVPPLPNPIPVGAVVPQFYGYYVLDDDDKRNKNQKGEYLSPILLLEECGKPIVAEELSLDDRDECVSMIYRLHLDGWIHGSLFLRNIVKQPGPLSKHPQFRQLNPRKRGGQGKDWSFRVIDFGRTVHRDQIGEAQFRSNMSEETSILQNWVEGIKDLLY